MDLSVVCPFYNEEGILESALQSLMARLRQRSDEWELIVVDDGSTDGSRAVAERVAEDEPRVRVLGYRFNRGRGHALRTGIQAARGDVIVTTEIDLSWGESIIDDLMEAMVTWPEAEIVVASPHLAGGGYRNVPFKRVFLSRFGNLVIRLFALNAVTMNTGMTRAYRRELIQSLPLTEDGKEFHLEVILKATAFGARLREIPAQLEWKDYKHGDTRVGRKSSSRLGPLIVSHSMFSLFAHPVRYVFAISVLSLTIGFGLLAWAIFLYVTREVSAYVALLAVLMVLLGIQLFFFGVVLQQQQAVQRELWMLQRGAMVRPRPDQPGT